MRASERMNFHYFIGPFAAIQLFCRWQNDSKEIELIRDKSTEEATSLILRN